jgi:hypothetical protein
MWLEKILSAPADWQPFQHNRTHCKAESEQCRNGSAQGFPHSMSRLSSEVL